MKYNHGDFNTRMKERVSFIAPLVAAVILSWEVHCQGGTMLAMHACYLGKRGQWGVEVHTSCGWLREGWQHIAWSSPPDDTAIPPLFSLCVFVCVCVHLCAFVCVSVYVSECADCSWRYSVACAFGHRCHTHKHMRIMLLNTE